ncbi:hypothetical protein [uncultured Cohaesibacter sp.]|uniref:hypothetical protein n=1 Tax=uncultured Cohaesibacter sp. TaxID=1002546 RepID=UPI002AAC3DCB|nr:hypothetical protein [uncultured Cohaesibacter sp.]
MTTPDLSSAALDALRPNDLSTRALHQRQSAVFTISSSRAPDGIGQSEPAGLVHEGFSLESIPLVGDFFSVISSLFSSFESAPSEVGQGNTQLSDALARPPSHPSDAQAHLASAQDADGPLDLSRYLANLDLDPAGPIDLVGDSEMVDQSSATGESAAQSDPTILPQITGLAAHPANKIPLDTLAQMQTRYLQMTSEQD